MARRLSSKRREKAFRRDGATAAAEGAKAASGDRPEKQEQRRFLKQYVRWLWPNRGLLVFILLLSIVVAAFDLTWPLAIKHLIDELGSASSNSDTKLSRLNVFGVAVIGILVVKQTIDTFRAYRIQSLSAKVVFRLRRRLFHKLIGLPLATLGEMKTGGIVSRLSGDIDAVSGLVQMAIISPSVAGIRIVLTLGILLYLSWQLAIAALVALPFLAFTSYLWLRRVRPIYRSMREDAGRIDGRVAETFGGLRVVRAFRREPREEREYAISHHTVIRKSLFAARMELVLEAIWGLLIPSASLLIVWFGGRLMLQGKGVTIGDIFAFQIYAALLLPPVWQIVQSVSTTQKSLAAMERIFGVFNMSEDKPDSPDAVAAPKQVEEMRFEGVGFEYSAGLPVIRDFDLVVHGGATVALVGQSGAGKTTLTDLVARFHDPTSGVIRVNGIDLRKIRLGEYRSLLAIVQQETFLFDGSVKENIAYGRHRASDEQIIDAAKRANAHEFIVRLPEGYDTYVGERGFKLSGGQRQRLSIARAILADPRILILDEATSNLDTESEQLIQASLAELFKGRMTFVIAHRLSTITGADLIVVMANGQIVETGTHDELIQAQGLYYDMVERQRKSFGIVTEAV